MAPNRDVSFLKVTDIQIGLFRVRYENSMSMLFTGGSISNLYAFLAARHRMFPDYKQKGLSCIPGQLVMYTSDQVGHDKHTVSESQKKCA